MRLYTRHVPFTEVLLGLFILLAFIYGTYEMNRRGEQAREFSTLRERVLKHVDQNPGHEAFTLDDLQKAGVLSAEDVDFLGKQGITYQPVGARSPSDSICFIERRATQETRYLKNGRTEYHRNWTSPDQAHVIKCVAKPGPVETQVITIVATAAGNVVAEFEVEASSVHEANWTKDSRLVAIITHRHAKAPYVHFMDLALLLEVTPQGVHAVDVPKEILPTNLVPAQHAGKEIRWNNQWVMSKGWRDSVLSVESHGQGRVLAGGGQDFWYYAIHRFELQVANGKATIARRTQKHYKETPVH